MTNKNSKAILFVVLTLCLILPTVVSAAETDALLKQSKKIDFCTNLSSYSDEILARLTEKETDYAARVAASQTRYQERIIAASIKLDSWRDWWEGNVVEIYLNNFIKRAKTPEQKAAAEKFASTMRDAIVKRRAAIESAVTIYQNDAKAVIDARQSSVANYRAEFLAAVKVALEKAKTSCNNGVDSKVVKEQLRIDLKTARNNFKEKMKTLEKDVVKLKDLRDKAREAVKNARADFQTTFYNAKKELESAWKKIIFKKL